MSKSQSLTQESNLEESDYAIIRILEDRIQFLKVSQPKGHTLLHVATREGEIDTVSAIIRALPDFLNQQTPEGYTPLDLATDPNIISLLEKNGAQRNKLVEQLSLESSKQSASAGSTLDDLFLPSAFTEYRRTRSVLSKENLELQQKVETLEQQLEKEKPTTAKRTASPALRQAKKRLRRHKQTKSSAKI